MRSYAVLGYSGGKAKAIADVPIHFAIDDMQISEDPQMMVGHMVMQWLERQAAGAQRSRRSNDLGKALTSGVTGGVRACQEKSSSSAATRSPARASSTTRCSAGTT